MILKNLITPPILGDNPIKRAFMGSLLVFEAITASILIGFDRINTTIGGSRSFDNIGTDRELSDGTMDGSNWVDLTGSGATVDLPVFSNLSEDLLDITDPTILNSDETTVVTIVSNDVDLAVTEVGTSTLYPRIKNTLILPPVIGETYWHTFKVKVNSGTCKLRQIFVGSAKTVNVILETGIYSYQVTSTNTTNRVDMYFDGTELFDIEITNWTVHTGDIPSTSTIIYHDYSLGHKTVQPGVDTPTAPYHLLTDTFQSYFTTDIPVVANDLLLLDETPELIYALWFGDLTTGLSFTKANVKNFVPGVEGLRGEEFLQDLVYPLGADLALNGTFDTDKTNWGTHVCSTLWQDYYGNGRLQVTLAGNSGGATQDTTVEEGEIYVVTAEFTGNQLTTGYRIEMYNTDFSQTFGVSELVNGVDEHKAVITFKALTTDLRVRLTARDANGLGVVFYVDNYTLRKATAYEIVDYINSTRTSLENTNKGASNLLIVQHGSGRPTAMTPANTIAIDEGGKSVTVPYTPRSGNTTIVNTVSGELQDFGDEELNGIPFVFGTNIITDNNDGTFTLNVVDDSRGFYWDIISVIGEEYHTVLNVISTDLNIGSFWNTDTALAIASATETGVSSQNYTATTTAARVRLKGANVGSSITFSMSVKELTGKTQRKEKRTLTYEHIEQETLLYIETDDSGTSVLQEYMPTLPDSDLVLNKAVIGYPDDVTTVYGDLIVHGDEITVPT